MSTWKELRNQLNITEEDERIIEIERQLIRTMVDIREEKGLTQMQLAEMCNLKQPVIARLEKDVHSPRVDSLLKILASMGYTLQIVPYNGRK
ncbi:MAG: helix-turn-helix transcriptional regulator [Lachnospiraceae bacterium]|nr:helix-turn-helix transcriptional regulator [Lachnospiraceae bacterium]